MRQKIKQHLSRMSLFWRYFFFLTVVAGVFLVTMLVATGEFGGALQQAYLDQARIGFEQNCQKFSRDLFLSHSLPPTIENAEDYSLVAGMSPEGVKGRVYTISVLHDDYMRQCALLGMPTEGFVYFKRSGVSFTHYRVFAGEESCFDSYLQYDRRVIPSIEEIVRDTGGVGQRLLPVCDISVGGKTPEGYLTLIALGSSRDVVYGFLYPQQTILDYFHLEALPEDTSLRLIGAGGEVLFEYGAGKKIPRVEISASVDSVSCTAVVGIPRSYFRQTIAQAQTATNLMFLLSVVLGILLCLYFSHASVRPFRRLIRDHAAGLIPAGKRTNELAVIDGFLRSTQQKNAAMRSMLLSSVLVRAYSGLHIPEEEYDKLDIAFPMFRQSMQVAVVRDRAGDQELENHSSMMSRLQAVLPQQILCEYINLKEAVLLFQAEEDTYQALQRAMVEVNREDPQEPRFICGVSAPFTGLEQIGGAIRQAQFCAPEEDERMVIPFAENTAGEDESPAASQVFRNLQQALASWSQQEVLEQIEQFALCVGRQNAVRPEEAFYGVLFLLRDAAYNGKIFFEPYDKLAYLPTRSPMDNLRRLKQTANDLFDRKAQLLQSDRQQLCGEIVAEIRESYGDANLCLTSLAQQFCVSERFVYNAVQSVTGMNFSSFLTTTRMQEAARLLRETEENIGTVAARCGYPVESTFYRNFKKYYHLTPVEYKNASH